MNNGMVYILSCLAACRLFYVDSFVLLGPKNCDKTEETCELTFLKVVRASVCVCSLFWPVDKIKWNSLNTKWSVGIMVIQNVVVTKCFHQLNTHTESGLLVCVFVKQTDFILGYHR